jgi:5-methylcytosine-specific restriction endonuclease McrA
MRNWLLWSYRRCRKKCHYCNRRVRFDHDGTLKKAPDAATIDHKQPKSQFPGRVGWNLQQNRVVACRECNSRKADMPYEIFVEIVRMEKEGHHATILRLNA